MIFSSTRKMYMAEGSDSKILFSKLDKRINSKALKKQYSEIRKLSDLNLSKSDRRKIRQDLLVLLVNELYGIKHIDDYKSLELLMKNSPDLRKFVKDLRNALTGMTTMMSEYVDMNISFEAWEMIVEGREALKDHYKSKAAAIKSAAEIFKSVQTEWADIEKNVIGNLPMESRIDQLTNDDLSDEANQELLKFKDDQIKYNIELKKAIRKMKASELSKYQINPTTYSFPSRKSSSE